MTVEQLAAERGRSVEDLLAACRQAGVLAWSGFTPLDEREVEQIDAALAAAPPAAAAFGAPPPAAGAPGWGAPVPPPGAGGPPPPPPFGAPPASPGYGAPTIPPPPGTPPPPGGYAPLKPSPAHRIGRGAAIAAAVVVSIGVRAGVGGLFGGDDGVDRNDRSGLVDLAVGTCYLDRSSAATVIGGGVDADADEVDCAEAHDGEVYHRDVLPGGEGAPYLGDDLTFQRAAERCLPRFEPFVGLPYDQSTLDFVAFYPSSESWQFLDDRTVICAVVTVDGSQLTGTMAGSQR